MGIKLTTNVNTHREAFLHFDLSDVNTVVGNATLKLFNVRDGDSNVTYKAEFVSDDSWTESSIARANSPVGEYEIGRWTHNGDVKIFVRTSN